MTHMRFLCLALVCLFLCAGVPAPAEEGLTAEVNMTKRLSMIRSTFPIEGTLTLSRSADRVECEIVDLRQLTVEYANTYSPASGQLSIDLQRIVPASAFFHLKPGEKMLALRVYSGSERCEAGNIRFTVLGYPQPHPTITRRCTYPTVAEPEVLWNGVYYHGLSWHKTAREDALTVLFPAGQAVSMAQIEWTAPPSDYTFAAYDAEGACVFTRACPDSYDLYCETFHLDESVRRVVITLPDPDDAIAALHVFAQDGPTVDVQDWRPMPEKLDLMLIPTHQDDELLFFGGSIPYYSSLDCEVGVVYMANCTRRRYAEALSGLWIAGLKNHPVFLGFPDGVPETYDIAVDLWGGYDAVVSALVEQIRRYRPEVIVTHGEDGEYHHRQHILTSEAVLTAVIDAADPEKIPGIPRRIWHMGGQKALPPPVLRRRDAYGLDDPHGGARRQDAHRNGGNCL